VGEGEGSGSDSADAETLTNGHAASKEDPTAGAAGVRAAPDAAGDDAATAAVVERLDALDIAEMTPLEAMNALADLKADLE
jgi:hypothetical protein